MFWEGGGVGSFAFLKLGPMYPGGCAPQPQLLLKAHMLASSVRACCVDVRFGNGDDVSNWGEVRLSLLL